MKRRALLCLLWATAVFLLADVTGDLRPIADGTTNQGDNTGGTACSTAECSLEVDETSGASCSTTPADGDTTYARVNAANEIQTFDLPESSIAAGSTVTQIQVFACSRKTVSQAVTMTLRACNGATCTEGTGQTQTTSYADYDETINVADFGVDGSDIEIGFKVTESRELRVSAMKAVVTYSLPATGGGARRVFVSRLHPFTVPN